MIIVRVGENELGGCYCFKDLDVDVGSCTSFENTGYKTYKVKSSDGYRRVCKLAAAPLEATARVRVRGEPVDTRQATPRNGRVLHRVLTGGCDSCGVKEYCASFDRHDKWVGSGGVHGVVGSTIENTPEGCAALKAARRGAWEVWRNQVTHTMSDICQPNGYRVLLALLASPQLLLQVHAC